MSDAPSPRWVTGILALIVAAAAIGGLGRFPPARRPAHLADRD
jgi:hypothetical protein